MGRSKQRIAERNAITAEFIRAHQRKERRHRVLIYGVGALALVALVGGATAVLINAQHERVTIENEVGKPISGVRSFPDLSRNHVTAEVPYAQDPPVGGDHSSVYLNCGTYSQPIDEARAVHSLEHGAVWVTYRPSLTASEVQLLAEQANSNSYEILSPRDNLPSPIVASAWGVQLQLQSADDRRISVFLKKYAQGPQAPEPGAACSGAPQG